MPFTPFHLGPGAAFKAAGRGRLSFCIFAGTQVIMDLEVLVRMFAGSRILHGYSHTYLGATAIGLVCALVGKPLCEYVFHLWNRIASQSPTSRFYLPVRMSWTAALVGAFVGSYSHVLFDSIMHGDMMPLWPFSSANPMHHIMDVGSLHALCLGAGVLGVILIEVVAPRGKDNHK